VTDTPPWQVDEWDLSADLAKVQQQWTAVREILSETALYDLRAPSVSEWTGGEQAGHILLVAQRVAAEIDGNLADPERNRDGAQVDFAHRLLQAGTIPRGRVKSPEPLSPLGRGRAELEALLPGVERAWEAISARAPELPGCAARGRHFVLGYLTCTEWVRMCAVHTAHHLAIVRDMRDLRSG
jgi:hypothetical protein